MEEQLEGQMSLFDFMGDTKEHRPAAYKFKRYIGQKVQFHRDGTTGIITEIEPYYTTIMLDDGKQLVGTPYNISPLRTCSTCKHWNPYTHGWEPEPVGYACFGFGVSKSDNADKPACDTYEEREAQK